MLAKAAFKTAQILSAISFKGDTSDEQTPWELAVKMVDDIPSGHFNTEALVPGSGFGVFALALIYRGWDPAKITCVEIDPRFILITRKWIGRFEVNFIHDNFLTWQPNMVFDVIINNPPYQDSSSAAKNVKLWPKFVARSIEILKDGGFISFITPDSWVSFDTSQSCRQRKIIVDNIDLDKIIDESDSFNVAVSISRWSGVKRAYSGQTQVWGRAHDLSIGPYLSSDEQIREIIHNKIKQFSKLDMKMGNPHISKNLCKEESGVAIRFSGSKRRFTHCEVNDGGIPKFVAPFSCSAYSRFFTTDSVGMLNMWMPASEVEAEKLSAIWDLKVVRFFIDTYQKTAGFTPAVKNNLIPDFREFNDQQAFEALNLSQEEINVVEAHYK